MKKYEKSHLMLLKLFLILSNELENLNQMLDRLVNINKSNVSYTGRLLNINKANVSFTGSSIIIDLVQSVSTCQILL